MGHLDGSRIRVVKADHAADSAAGGTKRPVAPGVSPRDRRESTTPTIKGNFVGEILRSPQNTAGRFPGRPSMRMCGPRRRCRFPAETTARHGDHAGASHADRTATRRREFTVVSEPVVCVGISRRPSPDVKDRFHASYRVVWIWTVRQQTDNVIPSQDKSASLVWLSATGPRYLKTSAGIACRGDWSSRRHAPVTNPAPGRSQSSKTQVAATAESSRAHLCGLEIHTFHALIRPRGR